MLSILDILLFSISYIQQILANCPPFINLPEASRCCVSFEEHISLCKLAKIRKYNETFNSNSIICLLHAFHHKKHDFFLTLPILNIQVEKEKEKRGPSTVPHPMHSSSSNTSNLIFPAALSLERLTFNRQVKLTSCFKSIDKQNNPLAFSFLYFDDCCALGKVTYDKIITSRVQDHWSLFWRRL